MSSSPYAPAGNILNQIIKTKKGLKTIAYNQNGELKISKTAYAQSSHVLQHKPLLDKLLREVEVDANNKGLLYVLLYELVLGPNKAIRGGGALKRQLLKQQEKLQAALEKIQPNFADKTTSDNADPQDCVTIPRYVRVNTIVSSTEHVVSQLDANTTKEQSNKKEKKTKTQESSMLRYMDAHVPNVLVFPPTASTRANLQDLVTSHQVVLQDKSSCFSALCMVHGFETLPSMEGDFLDACAAPGNKTSHLAALLTECARKKKQSSKHEVVVHALDKSKDRFQLLQRRMKELTDTPSRVGAPKHVRVECHNTDFLSINPETDKAFSKVTAIMLDPSCSGSGMISNHQEVMDRDPLSKTKNERIQSLSNFQFQALQHATTNFPKVNRVVYSTCSVYAQENEGVVQRLLESCNDEWELIAPKCLDHWKRRGLDHGGGFLSEEQLKCLIRVDPEQDGTNGFFVACFRRKAKSKGAKNDYKKPSATMGMELYANQFDGTSQFEIASKEEEKEVKPKQSKESSSNMEDKKNKSNNKRKAEAVEGDASESINKISSKKRAKKLEWKRKQHEKKMKRLANQQQAKKSS